MNYNLTGLILLDNRLNISQKGKRIKRYQKYYSINIKDLCKSGDLNGIKWKNKYNYEFKTGLVDFSARSRQFEELKMMDYAARLGHLEIVKWLHINRTEGCTYLAMDEAACYGHLEVVKWLHYNRLEGCSKRAMDIAAVGGKLEVVKWLHYNRSEGCTTDAIPWAEYFEHSEVVNFLKNTF